MDWKAVFKDKINNEFASKKVLVIGDLMVDEYIMGNVKRISPEAPVPVLDYRERRLEAGGACNVAHNLRSLGAQVLVAGVSDEDEAGRWLRSHFSDLDIDISCILSEAGRPTTLKTRYAVKGHQLLRVDNEIVRNINETTQKLICEYIEEKADELDAVIISDYKKGVLGEASFTKRIIQICNNNNILIAIDSKSSDIAAFANADFVKPNNLELEAAVGITIEDEETLNQAGEKYLECSKAKALVVTRGPKGISVFEPNVRRVDYPAKDVQVFDVCGAGDTVISTIAIGMCSGLSLGEAVKMANLAAGVVINKIGTVAISSEELVRSIDEE